MVLEYLSIEFIGHLWPWNYHRILNVHPPNGGMPHLLFLVAMRALRIYSSLRSISSISPKEPPSIFKPKATELVTGYLLFFPQRVCHHKQRGHHHVCGLHGEYAHYPNHRVRPHILSHSAPSLWINGRGWPHMIHIPYSQMLEPVDSRPAVCYCSLNHIEQDPIIRHTIPLHIR